MLFLLDNCYYLALARAVLALCVCMCLCGLLTRMTGEMLPEICLQARVPKAVELFNLPYNSLVTQAKRPLGEPWQGPVSM